MSFVRASLRARRRAVVLAAATSVAGVVWGLAAGPASAAVTPPGFDSVSLPAGCGGCAVTDAGNGEFEAAIEGGADGFDTAYATKEFGGADGVSGRVWTRDLIRVPADGAPAANLPVFQVYDVGGALVYEVYLDAQRVVRLWSPDGGLRTDSINLSTGVAAPLAGAAVDPLHVEISARANQSVAVRVNGVTKIALSGLSGATTGNQDSLRAGIIKYDSHSSGQHFAVLHSGVAASQTNWIESSNAFLPDSFDSTVIPEGCGGCAVTDAGNGEFEAAIEGGADGFDTAYATKEFGGADGVSGRVWTRDLIRVPADGAPAANLPVFQVYDVGGALVYEVYLDAQRVVRLWSPDGGLRTDSINLSTGVAAPLAGAAVDPLHVEISARANDSVLVRVDGATVISLTGLTGARTGAQQTLRAGIIKYATGCCGGHIAVLHSGVGVSTAGWLGSGQTVLPPFGWLGGGQPAGPARFDSIVTAPGCAGCSVGDLADGAFETSIEGGATGFNLAYAVRNVGGAFGIWGQSWVRDVILIPTDGVPAANLPILQMDDVNGALVYELYLNAQLDVCFWSPPGGVQGASLNVCTSFVAPLATPGAYPLTIVVYALANDAVRIRVYPIPSAPTLFHQQTIAQSLSGATTGLQDTLRVGAIRYANGSAGGHVAVIHSSVALSTAGWLDSTG